MGFQRSSSAATRPYFILLVWISHASPALVELVWTTFARRFRAGIPWATGVKNKGEYPRIFTLVIGESVLITIPGVTGRLPSGIGRVLEKRMAYI